MRQKSLGSTHGKRRRRDGSDVTTKTDAMDPISKTLMWIVSFGAIGVLFASILTLTIWLLVALARAAFDKRDS